jgi:hypothetical protein
MLIQKLIQLILASKTLNARKKWVIIRNIKNQELDENEINNLIDIFENEDKYMKESKIKYEKDLIEWRKRIEFIAYKLIPLRRNQNEKLKNLQTKI